ncbi:unnamed protein product [Linum trigynum]|uniref:Uncharacterized protein n=1 Tax=Linum trigynum TaxID=586398 RepID=A0AAV2GIT6_9ROSI
MGEEFDSDDRAARVGPAAERTEAETVEKLAGVVPVPVDLAVPVLRRRLLHRERAVGSAAGGTRNNGREGSCGGSGRRGSGGGRGG